MVVMAKSKNEGHKIGMEYEIEIRDRHGKLISKTKGEAKSWLWNFMAWLREWFALNYGLVPTYSINDITGTGRTFPTSASKIIYDNGGYINGDSGDENEGIVVGSSDVAVQYDDYALGSKIAHGTGAGQLVYNAQSLENLQYSGGVISFRVTRTFTNNSGSSVDVKEIGMYMRQLDNTGTARNICVARDVLASPQSVPDGATLTVRYTISVTVS